MTVHDRDPWWRVLLPPLFILGSPWLAVSVTVVIALMVNEVSPGSTAHRLIAFVSFALAGAGSAFGGLFVRGPLSMRIGVLIAVLFYALETYIIVLTIAVNVFSDVLAI